MIIICGERSGALGPADRKSTRLNSSHSQISYAVFCLKKKTPKLPSRDGSGHLSVDKSGTHTDRILRHSYGGTGITRLTFERPTGRSSHSSPARVCSTR